MTVLTAANAQSPLTVIQPSSLANVTKNMEASLGNFGHINYGQTIMGRVIYPTKDNKDGCQPLTWNDFETNSNA